MTTDTIATAAGDLFADALMQALIASAGNLHTLLDTTRTLPHTAYTGQLNTTVTARVRATVAAPGSTRASASLHLGFLTEQQWDETAGALATRRDALAALMSGRVHPDLLDPDNTAGHTLVPANIGFECTAHPPTALHPDGRLCEHTAILAHALAGRFRAQPSALLTIRGCSLGRLGAKLRTALTTTHRAAADTAAPAPAVTPPPLDAASSPVRADDAYSLWQVAAAQPASAPADFAVPAPEYGLPTPPPGVSPGIADMVAAAAQYAQDVLRGAAVEELDELVDAVRHLSTPLGAPLLETVAGRLGRSPAETRELVLAYRHGGAAGVHAAAGPLPASDTEVEHAQEAVISAQPTARGSLRASGNQITNDSAGVQLRLGPDRRWYPFAVGLTGRWQPVPGPSRDPAAAYRAARTVRSTRPRRPQP
ncbi:hypothetical protein ACI1MP_37320 (plasmid) [Kitasatospora griseola]|uniref:hypothetical protein n=1 Tax=Kitasatospora griseola TaxID=2064 RepID=UPI0038558221